MVSERADRIEGCLVGGGSAARRPSRKLVICVTTNAQKRDSEESCGGHERDADGCIYVYHPEYNLLEQTKIPIERTTSSRLLPRRSAASFSRSLSRLVASVTLGVSRTPTQNRPRSVPASTPSFRDSPDSLLYEYFISQKTRSDAAPTLFSIYVYLRRKTRRSPQNSLLY